MMQAEAYRLFRTGRDTLQVARALKISEAKVEQLIDQARNEKLEKLA